MKNLKKVLGVAVTCTVVSAMCISGSAEGEKTGGWKIGVSNYSLGNTYRVQMMESIQYYADQLIEEGVIDEITILNSDGDANKQVSDIQDLITAGCNAILVTCATEANCNSVLEEAMDEGIVVCAFNSLPSIDVDCKVIESDTKFGDIMGEWLVDKLDGKGKVIVLNGTAGNSVSENRYAGTEKMFQESDIEVLGTVYGDWDYATTKVAVEGLLAANPEIDGIWSQGGAMTLAAIDAFEEAGRDLIPMTGESNNGLLKAWDKFKDTAFDCIAPITSDKTGTIALQQAIKKLEGEEIENVELELNTITSDNLADYLEPDLPDSYWVGSDLPTEVIEKLFSN